MCSFMFHAIMNVETNLGQMTLLNVWGGGEKEGIWYSSKQPLAMNANSYPRGISAVARRYVMTTPCCSGCSKRERETDTDRGRERTNWL